MVAFLTGLHRGATAFPKTGCFLPPVDLLKELFSVAFLEKSVHLFFGKRDAHVFLQVFDELFLWIRRWGSACFA